MSREAAIPPPSRSWKDIRQGVSTRAMSRQGRRRMVWAGVKLAFGCVAGAGLVVAALVVYQTWVSDPARLKEPVKSVPLRQVIFSTDGVLERAWLDQTLALPRTASLMGLDLTGLERRLLESGQVQSVVLRRRFTDNSLEVAVHERVPVARLMVQSGDAVPRMRLVAADGVVYEGTGYDRTTLERLLWLDGVALRRSGRGGLEPIAGMDAVANLLRTAEGLVPRLYAGWRIVSLARLASDGEIIVRSRDVPEIIFDTDSGFPRQLAKLDYIVESMRAHGNPPVARIDFSVGSQVPVELQTPGPRPAGGMTVSQTLTQPRQRRDF